MNWANEAAPQTDAIAVAGRIGWLVAQPQPAIKKTNGAMPQTNDWAAAGRKPNPLDGLNPRSRKSAPKLLEPLGHVRPGTGALGSFEAQAFA